MYICINVMGKVYNCIWHPGFTQNDHGNIEFTIEQFVFCR